MVAAVWQLDSGWIASFWKLDSRLWRPERSNGQGRGLALERSLFSPTVPTEHWQCVMRQSADIAFRIRDGVSVARCGRRFRLR